MDNVSEARLALVLPALAAKIRTLAVMLEQEGILIRVVQGLRTWAEQAALYQQGRTAPGNIVTMVDGGYSYHNFGLAVDCVPSLDGTTFIPDWNAAHPAWKNMEGKAAALGLECGATWRSFPDAPHFQLTGPFPVGEPTDQVRQLFKDGGTAAVWQEIQKEN